MTVALTVLSGCSFGPPPPDETGTPPNLPSPSPSEGAPDPSVMEGVIASGLAVPWGITFLPDGSALVTERDSARILHITLPEEEGAEPVVDEVQTIAEAVPSGEGGLLGIAASPDYEDDETVYIYYTAESDNRIASLKLGEDPDPIVTGIPKAGNHNGGQLAFGPDGYLYASTGDAGEGDRAQERSNLAGKILRMTEKGDAAPGNPFGDSLVYSMGHRNIEGLAWSPNETLFATEFGEQTADEINKIEAGGNYGWPDVEGTGGKGDLIDPVLTFPTEDASCAGAAFADTILLTACLRGERLWSVEFTTKGTIVGEPTESLTGELGRLRFVAAAPDGSLWVSTSNKDGRGTERDGDDKIIRIIVGGSSESKT
ncbi:PQQ-dependent sugar dehydrogenase [Stackebrandtia soli]|uniref:PQQ-dependent sugar dehydrogenase n=1 Tax=Stackebrandtia soli TaxID=1892856 RepID=UPI0039EC92CD